MTNPWLQTLLTITVFDVVKWFLVVGLVMYAAFAAIIVRQVGVMKESIEDTLNLVILGFAWVHLIAAIALVVVAAALL